MQTRRAAPLALIAVYATAIATGACGPTTQEGRTARPRVTAPLRARAAPPEPPFLVAGGAHTCARASGALHCWGRNEDGELGDGTKIERSRETVSRALEGAQSIAFGGSHGCGITDGHAICWGENRAGQLGDGTTTARSSPAPVIGLESAPIAEVVSGTLHSCARTTQGEVWCWGDNDTMQVGTAAPAAPPQPAPAASDAGAPQTPQTLDGHEIVVHPRRVPLAAPAARLVAHGGQTCAQLASGAISCWGGHWAKGWLGDASTRDTGRAPTELDDLRGARSIALGDAFICGSFPDGSVRCHGDHVEGQLGDPATECCTQPPRTATVAGIRDASAIVAADRSACALRANGAVWCWGADLPPPRPAPGQPRAPARADASHEALSTPRAILPSGAVALAAGAHHVCALRADGQVSCWGDDEDGQLGDAVSRHVAGPAPIALVVDATELAVGYVHTCVRRRERGVLCLAPEWHAEALDSGHGLAAGVYETCAITAHDTATCIGRTPVGMIGVAAGPVRFAFEVASLSMGDGGICGLGAHGEVACTDEYSDAHTIRVETASRTARPLRRARGITALAVGSHACGVTGSTLRCWNASSPASSGSVSHLGGNPIDVALDASDPPVGVAVGEDLGCVWTRGGRALCWTFPVGTSRFAPAPVAGLSGVLQIAAGSTHVCARTADAIWCWGQGARAQLGPAAQMRASETPVRIPDLAGADVADIDAGTDRTCARLTSGRVLCWGYDDRGVFGRAIERAPRGPVDVLPPIVGPRSR